MGCPNKSLPEYKKLEELFGEDGARIAWLAAGETNPTPVEAIKLLYPDTVEVSNALSAWDTGTLSGKDQKTFEPQMEKLIVSNPNAKIGGGESFNQVRDRSITEAKKILETASNNTAVVTHSTILKFLLLWDKMGRPTDLSGITADKYLKENTSTGEVEKMKGANGDVYFIRHGETEDNEDGKMRTPETMLTNKGIKQADKVGNQLKNTQISKVIVSPLPRAIHTTERIMLQQPQMAISELEEKLNSFVKSLNFDVQTVNDIKEMTGYDTLSTVDSKPVNQSTKESVKDFMYQLANSTGRATDAKLDEQVTKFLNSIGVSVEKVKEIMTSRGMSAVAMTNTINKIIKVANGKAGIDTLSEEAAHLFVDMLPEKSTLLRDLLKDVRTRDIYKETMDKYGDLDEYKNEDGSINTDKIAREAAGQMIANAIVQEFDDNKAKSIWQRVWDFIKSIFKGKEELTPYQTVAKSILSNDTSKLNATYNGKGIYYQLDKDEEAIARKAFKRANPVQAKIIEEVYFAPHKRYRLENDTHIYKDSLDRDYTSITTGIGNDFPADLQDEYEQNRNWGNDVDKMMQDICLGKKFEDIKTKYLSEKVKNEVYTILAKYYGELSVNGAIVLPQVIVADEESMIAGSIDLLVIDRYGNMRVVDIKTSWNKRGSSSFRTTHGLKAESRIVQATANSKEPVTGLNKTQTHGAQIGAYAKMLQLQGWFIQPVDGLATKHIFLERSTTKDATGKITTVIVDAQDEGEHTRNVSDNKTFVDALVPTALTNKDRLQEINDEFKIGNPFRDTASKEAPVVVIPDNIEELLEKKLNEINTGINKFSNILEELSHMSGQRWIKDATGKLQQIAQFKVRDETVQKVDKLYEILSSTISHESKAAAYTKFLEFMQEQLQGISKFLIEKEKGADFAKNVGRADYLKVALLGQKFIASFDGIMDLNVFGNAKQHALLASVVQQLNNTNADIVEAVRQYNMQGIGNTTSRKNLTVEMLSNYVKEDRDISDNETNFGTLGNSGVVILENADKRIKARYLDAEEIANQMISDLVIPVAEMLRKANGGKITNNMYDFMMRKDRNGKKMGQIISQIGRVYREMQDKIYNGLTDLEGHAMTYKEIKDITTASKEDIEYNKKLFYKKQAQKEFENAEEFDAKGNISSGEYHKYSDEFLEEREKYMEKIKLPSGDYMWEFAYDFDDQERQAEVVAFQRKYFREIPSYMSAETNKKGEPTGKVTEKFSVFFPKKEYVEVRDTVKSTGEVIADKGYYELMNPTTALGKAQKEYYMMYVDTMVKIQDMLPTNAAEIFKRGAIPSLGANWVQKLSNGDINLGTLMANAVKAQFETPVAMGKDVTANSGSVRQSIPLLYVAPLQSQLQLDKINNELKELETKKGTMSEHDYAVKKAYLDNLIKKEKNKMKAVDLHPDLSLGLTEMLKAATQFQAKSDIEDDLIAVNSQLINMEFTQEVRKFGVSVGAKKVSGIQSNAYKRFNAWLDMCFYHDPLMNRSTADAVAKKLMGYTSALGVSFNVFGWVNNAIAGSTNNFLDSLGSDFFDFAAMRRMTLTEFPKAMIGYMRAMMEHKVKGSTYEKRIAGSKYEWLCEHFHAVEQREASVRGQVNWLAKAGGYSGMEAGEYMMQSKVANAILASIPIKGSITDPVTGEVKELEEIMLYDAFDFDEKTGHGKLKNGYSLSDKEKHDITNRIKETIDRIHGNYSPINKTMFERQWWGQFIMQFHKWVWPNFKQRFQAGKYDENLGGGMDIEGRYRTLWGFVTKLHSLADLTNGSAWNRLTKHQKSNMKKDLADAITLCVIFATGLVIKAIADGVPDDDPNLKRWIHFLQMQNDRSFAEVGIFVPPFGIVESYQMFKNPIAGAGGIREFAGLLQASYQYPFVDDEHRYYQKGAYKGESHVAKEARDVVPILKEYNKIQSLVTTNTFYVK